MGTYGLGRVEAAGPLVQRTPILLLAATGLFVSWAAFARPSASPGAARPAAPEAPPPLSLDEQGRLLQAFADRAYGKGFRELGAERDCDHGHLLYAPGAARPFAVLFHTQESAAASAATRSPSGGLDPLARNWLQRLDTGEVSDARRFLRSSYPPGAWWDWFRALEVPRFQSRGTLVPEMLDPERLGSPVAGSRQWVFARAPCAGAPRAPPRPAHPNPHPSDLLTLRLPGGGELCLRSRWD